jgi:hypothetical protein
MIPHTNCPSLLADTLKAKIALHSAVYEEAIRAYEGIKHLGNSLNLKIRNSRCKY